MFVDIALGIRVEQISDRSTLEQIAPDWNVFEPCFDTLLRLHNRSWTDRGGSKAVDHDKLESFHRESARSFLTVGLLRLHVLKLSSRPIAALYGFQARKRVYYYLAGFDHNFSKLSLGAILIAHAIEQSIASGAKEFDFLRGQEAYKYQWGAKDQRTCRCQWQ